jgi:hypothetical protein
MKHFESATPICNKIAVAVKRGKQKQEKARKEKTRAKKKEQRGRAKKPGTRKNGIPDYKR